MTSQQPKGLHTRGRNKQLVSAGEFSQNACTLYLLCNKGRSSCVTSLVFVPHPICISINGNLALRSAWTTEGKLSDIGFSQRTPGSQIDHFLPIYSNEYFWVYIVVPDDEEYRLKSDVNTRGYDPRDAIYDKIVEDTFYMK